MNLTKLSWMFVLLVGQLYSQANMSNLALHRAAWSSTQYNYLNTAHLATDGDTLNTFWKSAARSDSAQLEWVYVDLGKIAEVSQVIIRWGKAYGTIYSIQGSNAPQTPKAWSEIKMIHKGNGGVDQIDFPPRKTRFIRVLILGKTTKFDPIFIRSLEVYGAGTRMQSPIKPHSGFDKKGRYLLDGRWKLQNAAQVQMDGHALSSQQPDTSQWLNATVPGTVLSTYLDNGAIPNPNYSDWQLQVSEHFTTSTYWYRTEFELPQSFRNKEHLWLNFNGINYRADIYLNGQFVKTIERCFLRNQLDISPFARFDGTNTLAVKIHPVKNPGNISVQNYNNIGKNGGKLGADNPTFHFSVGWDWNPTVRGRNIGIWDEVFLRASDAVTLHDPYVITQLPLPDTSKASLSIKAWLHNHQNQSVNGTLSVQINQDILIEKRLSIPANSREEILLSPDAFPQLKITNPELWWPNGYGKPTLHTLQLKFITSDGAISDSLRSRFGIRTIDYDYNDQQGLQLVVNGQKVLCRGGNWGSNDINIRFEKEKYERQIRYHQEMNFNMIRNWVGQTGHELFYDYCDQYGILVWDDFWLANGWDGPNPKDKRLFIQNVRDKILKLRHHPSVALWCGRNETKAPQALENAMAKAVKELDGQRFFIKNSRAFPARRTSGPWHLVESPQHYFDMQKGFLTELGMPCVPPVESIKRMMPETAMWPINELWGLHDFGRGAAKADTYTKAICKRYGDSESIEDYCQKAQLVNWVNYKALFEAWGESIGEGNPGGVLLWMSQATWPSLVWQTYDYYFEQTGAYFGSKIACEPIHIQWNSAHTSAFVINTSQHNLEDLTAEVWIYNLDGKLAFHQNAVVDVAPFNKTHAVTFPLAINAVFSEVHFIKMALKKQGQLISENFYWRSKNDQDYRALDQLPMLKPQIELFNHPENDPNTFSVRVKNESQHIMLAARVKLVDPATDLSILPVNYSDNYFSLTPESEKVIQVELPSNLHLPEGAYLEVEGWNIIPEQNSQLPLSF